MAQNIFPQLRIYPLAIAPSVQLSQLFTYYTQQHWAMLLDSGASEHVDARFDIMVAQPIATIVTKNKINTVKPVNEEPYTNNDNPLTLIEQLQQRYFTDVKLDPLEDNELPFMVGALGYFGYDLSLCFEDLPQSATSEYDAPDMAVGIYTWSIIKDRSAGRFYLCALDHYAHPTPDELVESSCLLTSSGSFILKKKWQANMTAAEYRAKLQQVYQYLRSGDCYQVNFAQRFISEYEGDEWQAYLTLTHANKAPFSAFIRLPQCCILSISPERFLAVKDKRVETKPIKGTRPRSKDPVVDQQAIEQLQNAEKDRAENLMIVDLLRNDLSKHCRPHSVKVPELFQIESFPAVHHLVSTVIGELNDESSVYALFEGAFPGGSITGAPKIRAMEIINELEPNQRNIYCGSIAYFGIKQDMDSSICIRTLLCEKNHIYCWAGGGIVIDSNPIEEYQESLDKVAKILPLLENLS